MFWFLSRQPIRAIQICRDIAVVTNSQATSLDLLYGVLREASELRKPLAEVGLTDEAVLELVNRQRSAAYTPVPAGTYKQGILESLLKIGRGPQFTMTPGAQESIQAAWKHCWGNRRRVLTVRDVLQGILQVGDAPVINALEELRVEISDIESCL